MSTVPAQAVSDNPQVLAPTDVAALIAALVDPAVATTTDGAIVCFNEAAEALFGYSAAECVGNDVSMLMPENVAAEHGGYMSKALDGGGGRAIGMRRPVTARRKDGKTFAARIALSVARLTTGTTYLGIVTPLDRLDALREFVESSIDATIVIDESGKVMAFNTTASELFERPTADVVGQNVKLLMPEVDAAKHDQYLERRRTEDQSRAIGIRRPVYASTPSGGHFPVNIALSQTHIEGERYYIGIVSRRNAVGDAHMEALRQLLESAVDPSIAINGEGKVVVYNQAAQDMFGYRKDDVIGENVALLMPPEYASGHDDQIKSFLTTSDTRRAVGMRRPVVALTQSGEHIPIKIALSHLQLPSGHFFVGAISRITSSEEDTTATVQIVDELIRKRTETIARERDEFERLSSVDGLTSLANRRMFDLMMDRDLRRCARVREPLSLIMLDIDHFKAYNDHYGHQGGDECLKAVADCIKASFRRGGDTVARYGGEEFAVIMSDTPHHIAVKLAERLRENLKEARLPHATSPTADHVTASIGIASIIPDKSTTPEDVIRGADSALYEAKRSGRDRVIGTDLGDLGSMTQLS